MKIGLFVGHSLLSNGNYTSAKGYCTEYLYNKELATYIKKWLEVGGAKVDVIICPEKKFTKAYEEKTYKLPIANSTTKNYDLIVELHLNAYKTTDSEMGAEVLYSQGSTNGKAVAQRVQNKLKTVFKDRGVKARNDLYILNSTKPTAILLETFFCDSKGDYNKAKSLGYDKLGKLISEGILNKTLTVPKVETTNTTTTTTSNGVYRVVVGSYKDKNNAISIQNKLKKDGYDSFLIFEKQ
jgi:N-acetylmuramoyl-L-alanine amidase